MVDQDFRCRKGWTLDIGFLRLRSSQDHWRKFSRIRPHYWLLGCPMLQCWLSLWYQQFQQSWLFQLCWLLCLWWWLCLLVLAGLQLVQLLQLWSRLQCWAGQVELVGYLVEQAVVEQLWSQCQCWLQCQLWWWLKLSLKYYFHKVWQPNYNWGKPGMQHYRQQNRSQPDTQHIHQQPNSHQQHIAPEQHWELSLPHQQAVNILQYQPEEVQQDSYNFRWSRQQSWANRHHLPSRTHRGTDIDGLWCLGWCCPGTGCMPGYQNRRSGSARDKQNIPKRTPSQRVGPQGMRSQYHGMTGSCTSL